MNFLSAFLLISACSLSSSIVIYRKSRKHTQMVCTEKNESAPSSAEGAVPAVADSTRRRRGATFQGKQDEINGGEAIVYIGRGEAIVYIGREGSSGRDTWLADADDIDAIADRFDLAEISRLKAKLLKMHDALSEIEEARGA